MTQQGKEFVAGISPSPLQWPLRAMTGHFHPGVISPFCSVFLIPSPSLSSLVFLSSLFISKAKREAQCRPAVLSSLKFYGHQAPKPLGSQERFQMIAIKVMKISFISEYKEIKQFINIA